MDDNQRHGIRRHVDPASLAVIVLTLVLFVAALAVKGISRDLLLESGVFLVSVKLIVMAYKASVATRTLSAELAAIRSSLARLESRSPHEPAGSTRASTVDG